MNLPSPSCRARSREGAPRKAFTLIESLVTLAVLAIWCIVGVAVIRKVPSPEPSYVAPPAPIVESVVGSLPEPTTRAATFEDDADDFEKD